MAELILEKLQRMAAYRKGFRRALRHAGLSVASHTTDGAVSIDISTSIGSPLALCTCPSLIPTKRGTAPSSASASCICSAAPPSTPSATSIAIRRVLMPCVPGRARSDSALGGLHLRLRRSGQRFRERIRKLRHAQAVCDRAGQLFCNIAQLRHHSLAHGGRLHLRELEAVRADDVQLLDIGLAVPEQRRLVVVLGELLRLAPDLVSFHLLREGGEARRRACLERASPAKGIGLVRHATARDRLPVHAVALVVVRLGDGRIDRDLVEIGARPAA